MLDPTAREVGGRREEVDSTGVLLRLPIADMLSIVTEFVPGEQNSLLMMEVRELGNCETRVFRPDASMHGLTNVISGLSNGESTTCKEKSCFEF